MARSTRETHTTVWLNTGLAETLRQHCHEERTTRRAVIEAALVAYFAKQAHNQEGRN